MRQLRKFVAAAVSFPVIAIAGLLGCPSAEADTLDGALVQAYQNNPSLNAQRAALRATDENVPQALSGYRPKLSVTANAGYNYNQQSSTSQSEALAETFVSRGYGANTSYTLFNGYQTANQARRAESQVDAARETLRVTEQQVLLDAATAYMNLLRDKAIVDLNRSNVDVLTEELKQTHRRYVVGELGSTDVAQSASRLAGARGTLLNALSNYTTSQANYRRVIGVDPGSLAPGTPVDRLSPNTLAQAIVQGEAQNPSVLAAAYGADVAQLAVKVSEGALYPSVAVAGSVTRGADPAFEVNRETDASLVGTLTVPIYQGGAEYSLVRQSKEALGQQRLSIDVTRDQARETVVQSWAQRDAAKAQIEATAVQVNGAEIALNGVRGEARVGQRTTLDVLNAQQELVNARVAVVTAQHDRVVASYALLAATGSLSVQHLGLNVAVYDPTVHYQQVRDVWAGVRTPDGQ